MTTSQPAVSTGRDDLILALYQRGAPVAEIASTAGVCAKTVRNIARRAGLPPRNAPAPDRNREVVRRYAAGDRVQAIADAYGITTQAVRRIAARSGLPPRTNWRRRYPLDETAFDRPSQTGWWLVGLLGADGSINEAENRISLCQSMKDVDVLHAFYAYVGCPDRPLTMLNLSEEAAARQLPRSPAAEARIFSARIVRALARHGVVPRKTTSMRLSDEASSKTATWLGVLDGDGSVGIYRDGREPRIVFFGTKALVAQCEASGDAGLDSLDGHLPRDRTPGGFGSSACHARRRVGLPECSWRQVLHRCGASERFWRK